MKTLNQKASAAKFLLGGIGTGNISLDQNARLCDFELWNNPNKGYNAPYTFFAVRTQSLDGKIHKKVLESQHAPPYDRSHGANASDVGGLPRFRKSKMKGDYPFVNFKFTDNTMPVIAELEAFTPLIPLDVDNSSLPVGVLRYTIKNITDTPLTVSVAGSMANLCNKKDRDGKPVNRYVKREKCSGIQFLPGGKKETDLNYMEMALLTTEKDNVSYLDDWNDVAWWDGLQDFWNDFSEDGELTPGRTVRGKGNMLHDNQMFAASLCVKKNIKPGKSATFEFIISWYHPNRVKSWDQRKPVCDPASGCCPPGEGAESIKNYYAKHGPSIKSAEYLIDNLPKLESMS